MHAGELLEVETGAGEQYEQQMTQQDLLSVYYVPGSFLYTESNSGQILKKQMLSWSLYSTERRETETLGR